MSTKKNNKIVIYIVLLSDYSSYTEHHYDYSMFLSSEIYYFKLDIYIRSDFTYKYDSIFHKLLIKDKEIFNQFYKW